jgi:hypothetical protein
MSSILLALATIPATRAVTLAPALAPLSVGTLSDSSASAARPAFSARRRIGTSPAELISLVIEDHRNCCRGVKELHLRDLPCDHAESNVENFDSPAPQGISHAPTRTQPTTTSSPLVDPGLAAAHRYLLPVGSHRRRWTRLVTYPLMPRMRDRFCRAADAVGPGSSPVHPKGVMFGAVRAR